MCGIQLYRLGPPISSYKPRENGRFFDDTLVREARRKWPSRQVQGAYKEELWNKVKHDVVFGIKTGHEVANARLEKLRTKGWWSVGRDVPNVIVVSDVDDVQLGVVGVKKYGLDLLKDFQKTSLTNGTHHDGAGPVSADHLDLPSHWFDRSGWRGDKDKNLPALHLMKSAFPDKKWYLLLDDDTYIFLENFARYILEDGMNDKPVYTGKVFYISRCGGFARDGTFEANKSEPKGMFAHGGSGIIINRRAMDAMYPIVGQCIRDYHSCWAGDMQVGLCLRKAGVMIRRLGRRRLFERHFIPFWPSKALADRRYSQRWKSEEEPLTFHKIPEKEQELMSAFERDNIVRGDTVVYSDLREHLIRNGILPCHTAHNKKTRYYSTEFMPANLK